MAMVSFGHPVHRQDAKEKPLQTLKKQIIALACQAVALTKVTPSPVVDIDGDWSICIKYVFSIYGGPMYTEDERLSGWSAHHCVD